MILYEEDWALYPNAIADVHTQNQSWVRQAAVYREMGIKNHTFMLALHDVTLQGVDPFNLDLTVEQMARIAIECKVNPWYYFREVARAPAISGTGTLPYTANRGNIALFWCFFNHVETLLIQIRQTGKSFGIDQLASVLLNVMCNNTQINLLTKDDSLRAANIQRLKDIEAELPHYLRQRTRDDVNNTEELTIKRLGNSYKAHVPQKSPKMALNVGRGLTSPIFFIDEGPFQSNIEISLPAALAAGTAAREQARLRGEPYGTVLTTTAGKKDDRDGRFVYKFMQEAAEWTEKFFDAQNAEELDRMVRANSRKGRFRINITMNHRQLGRDDAWLKKVIEDSNASGEDADRDFGNVWTSGTLTSPLSISELEAIRGSQRPENHTTISKIGGYITKWFIPEEGKEQYMANNKFVMSMDTSDAAGGDDISLLLTDIRTGETVATGTFNETNLIVLAEWICDWIIKYPNILVCIERKSSGVAILDYLLLILPARGIDPFKRLFNRIVNDHLDFPDRYKEIQQPLGRRDADIYVRFKKAFGFATSGTGLTSRTELYSTTLKEAAKRGGNKVRDITTINQITGLIKRNGRVDHEVGEHDDMVIAWLLNYWLMSAATNMQFYGIDSREILMNSVQREELTALERYQAREQAEIRQKIEEIYAELKRETVEGIVRKLELQLLNLDRQLILNEGERFSADDLINSVREDKRKRKAAMHASSGVASVYGNYSSLDAYQVTVNPLKVF